MCESLGMYITNVEKEGAFLKLWGQIDNKAALDVELALFKAYAMYEEGQHALTPANIQIGVLCCAKYIDEKYYRARITNDDSRRLGTVEVNFIDFGNRDIVPISNLRSIDCFNATFITLPPLALPFILSEVICTGVEWNDFTLELISRQIRYMEVNYTVASTHLGYKIINMSLADKDLALHLVRNNLMQPISLETQESLLSAMIPRNPQLMHPVDQSLLQYKSVTLEPNSRHEIYVSYITDGPCHFSVQLKKSEAILAQLMREINSIPLKTFDELPIPGTVCLAKCMEDSHICRAVITSEVDNQYKLFYVDFGNTEVVPPDNIYQMPFKYIIPKIMAIRLSLDGVDKSTVTIEMQCAFKQFVDNRLLMMEVFPSAKKMCLPKCRMWDPETDTDVMDVLNKAAQLAYPNVIALHRGYTRPVKVTFVHSCNKFYIHLKSNEDELNHLMANLQIYCNSSDATYLENPKVGLPCCAQFAFDGQWYRSSIVSLNEDSAKVKYIDYGNEEDIPVQSLKTIEGQFLTCMRPQAIECCLNGYQKMTEDLDRDNKLEELILDQEFTMKVIDTIDNKSLVDLIDLNGCPVTTLLMDAMVNQTKVQVISNGNFENTTRKYGTETSVRNNDKFQDGEFWSPRDKSQNRMDKSEGWRQNSRKSPGSNSNENAESWRQTNNKNDKEWHDNTSNESFKRGRKNDDTRRRSPNTNRGPDNNWNAPEQNKNYQNRNSFGESQDNNYTQNNHSEWNGKDSNRTRNRNPRQDNEGYGNKDNSFNRNKPKNFNDSWNANNSTHSLEENEEFQGVKKKSRNFSGNNSNNTYKSKTDGDEWGSKKNTFDGDSYTEKKTYREKNSYDSDGSYRKGKQDRNYDGKTKYNDRGDYKKKPFRKDHDSHISDYEQTDGRKFNSKSDSKWTDKNTVNASVNRSHTTSTAIDPAPEDSTFQTIEVIGQQKVTLSWFHNPCSFFCQLIDSQQSFSTLMEEIQETYKDKASSYRVVGSPAIALFPEDNVFYRTRILKCLGNQFKVYYVDFGNISVVDKVWPIDKKFMELPMQAIPCGLGGIQPVEDKWPDPTAYTNYMQKEYLDCEFLGFEIDRYMVDLYSDNQEIKLQLIQDNLAKVIEPVIPSLDFDINFLIGQTFRAMIDYVNDLSDFAISLNSGIQLMCAAHNLAMATERFDDELIQKVGQVLIVYCDNIIENRLEVTLYDHVGNKLNILNPDEGAYESVEAVCPHLVIKPTLHGFVSHVEESTIVIQPSECADSLEDMLNVIYEHYNNLPQESTLIPEEGYLYAVCSGDSNWYRGRVISFDDEKISVLYVDYGNTEDVPFSSLRELDSKFYWWDMLAILVHVNVPTADLLEKQVTVQVYFGELGLEGEIVEVVDGVEPQQLEISNINQEFSNSCQITDDKPAGNDNSLEIPSAIPNENEAAQNDAGVSQEEIPCVQNEVAFDGTAVVLSHIDSPSDFYIQLADSQDAISELQSKLQEQIEEMPVLDNTSVGGLCAAPYSVDQMWYRSQILDADEDITTVRFIDYGNTDVIDNKAIQIKTLPAEFLALEEYATRCRLKIKPLEEEWSKATTDRFEELAYADNVYVQFINQDEKANYVELFSGDQNVKDILIAENLAVLDEDLVLDPKLKGYISHMNSPSEFWVQLDGWCAELEWIAEQLSNAVSFPDLEDFTPGSLCAAMFPDDEMWYRARILSNTVAGLEVLFLDYGNSCVCGNLKQLPEHLVMAPPLALKCSLQKPEGLFNWSPEAAQKFSDISADGQTEFTVKKLTTGETSIVELYVNDEAVSSKLLPTTDNVNVTEIESMSSFSVSKEGVVSNEKYRLEKIPGYEYNQDALEKFVEMNNEGKTCYGLEHLTDNWVRLYLNGNDIRKEILPILKIKCVQSPEVTPEVLQSNTNISEDSSNIISSSSQAISDAASEVPEATCDNDSKNNQDVIPQEGSSPEEEISSTSQIEAFDMCSTLLTETINTVTEGVSSEGNESEMTESPKKATELSSMPLITSDNVIDSTMKCENTEELSREKDISSIEKELPDASHKKESDNDRDVSEVSDNENTKGGMPSSCEDPLEENVHAEVSDICEPQNSEEASIEVCDNLQKEEGPQETQEESDDAYKHSDIGVITSETKDDNPAEISEGCPIVQEKEIDVAPNIASFDKSQKDESHTDGDEDAFEICDTANAENDTKETPKRCDTPSEKDFYDNGNNSDKEPYSEQVILDRSNDDVTPNITLKEKDESSEEHSGTSEILQETEIGLVIAEAQINESHDDGDVEAIQVCDTPNTGNNEDPLKVCDDLGNEACSTDVTIEVKNEILQETKDCEISKEERNVPTHGGDILDQTSEICDEVMTREILKEDHKEIHTDSNETRENIQRGCEAEMQLQNEKINEAIPEEVSRDSDIPNDIIVQQEESHKIAEESSDMCNDGVTKKIDNVGHEGIPTNDDENERRENIQGDSEAQKHPQHEEINVTITEEVSRASDSLHAIVKEESQKIAEESSNICDRLEKVEPTSDIKDEIPNIILREETKTQKTNSKVEFTETIMTSFSAPTISKKESERKLSPTKVSPKSKEIPGEPAMEDSPTIEE
ncbi:maternal protein tudor-like isoform X3 [Coccinella septempunctata]|uniref:maternal protein tudor-like isoform X3 n=1 Tax=Coccinella septempunctata TaxID=41139 RepID=UPI001D063E81|nr:maternal protein tudor-like isoform X3 [Coccinella septempunctata]